MVHSVVQTTADDHSFKVFDYTRVQRRSYYHPPTTTSTQTTSAATAASSTLLPPSTKLSLSRPDTPSALELQSQGGLDVEAQIADGGGLANVGGRGLQLNPGKPSESVEMARSVRLID